MDTSQASYITESSAKATIIALLAITSVVAVARLALGIYTTRAVKWEDGFFMLAFAAYATLSGMLLAINHNLFRLTALMLGQNPDWPTLGEDLSPMLQRFFATTTLLYLVLWSVKFSILAFYKQLLSRTTGYIRMWYALVAFCCIGLLAAFLSYLLACDANPTQAWLGTMCGTPNAKAWSYTSLWLNYALDVTTDLCIMLLPLGMIRKAQMPLTKKLGVGLMFSLGLVCIVFATVRVKEVGSTASSTRLPLVTWLEVWGTVECACACWVGAAPGIYRAVKMLRRTKTSYASSQPASSGLASKRSRFHAEIEMDGKYSRRTTTVKHSEGDNSSQEELAKSPHGINVTTETSVNSVERSDTDMEWGSPRPRAY